MTRRGRQRPADHSARPGRPTGRSLGAPAARLLAAAFAAAVVLVLFAGSAAGHTELARSDPPDAAVLAQPPRQIRLQFSEAVIPSLSSVELIASHGNAVAVAPPRGVPTDGRVIVVDVPDLPRSAYRVSWSTVSADDLHVSRGVLVFGVGVAAAGAEPVATDALASPLEVGIRWLDLAALAGLVGALLVAGIVMQPLRRSTTGIADAAVRAATRRVFRLAMAAGGLALVTGVALVLVEAAGVATAPSGLLEATVAVVAGTPNGAHWLVRQAAIAALVVVAADGVRHPDSQPGRSRQLARVATTIMGGAALAVAIALSSHLAGGGGGLPVPALALAVHLVAAAAWTGGLAAVAVAALPLLRAPAPAPTTARALLRRFSGLAVAAVAALGVSGLLATGSVVASPDALLLSAYGQALLLKGALFAMVGLVGLGHALGLHAELHRRLWFLTRLRRPTSRPRIGTSLSVEMAGGLAILAVAAFLGSTPPARGAGWSPAPADRPASPPAGGAAAARAEQAPVTKSAGDLVVTVAIRPNQPGPNFVEFIVHDTRRPPPAPIGTVTVHLTDPAGVDEPIAGLRDLGGGRHEASIDDLPMAGSWAIAVVIERPGLPDTTVRTPWTVLPAAPAPPAAARRPVLLSDRPLAPITTDLAGLVTLGILVVALLTRRRSPGMGGRTVDRAPAAITLRAPRAEPLEDA